MVLIPVSVSILVYIDLASAVQSLAPSGNTLFLRALMMFVEFFV